MKYRHLLLDLDNTLYPASGGMDEGITRRMLAFVAKYLGLSYEAGVALRAEHLGAYGTTLEWLKAEHGLTDEKAYFEAVHPPEEIAELAPDPALRGYLLSLNLPMTLLTNAPRAHAERLLQHLNIADIFLGSFDLEYHGGRGKPHPNCFIDTLTAVGFSAAETLFVDDHIKYVRGYRQIGGDAVLVDESGKRSELAQSDGFPVIRSIYELADFLGNS